MGLGFADFDFRSFDFTGLGFMDQVCDLKPEPYTLGVYGLCFEESDAPFSISWPDAGPRHFRRKCRRHGFCGNSSFASGQRYVLHLERSPFHDHQVHRSCG